MKAVATHDRPREKLQRLGAAALGDNELLAIVLGHGRSRASALDMANAVLETTDGAHGLVRTRYDDLCAIPGIGHARAAQILAAVELGRRTLTRPLRERVQIVNARCRGRVPAAAIRQPAGRAVRDRAARHEAPGDSDARAVGRHARRQHRPSARSVRRGRRCGAAALVLFHNHPSGDPRPSPDDVELTRRLAAAGVLMGIDVIDHVILADVRYYSFKEEGRF